MGSEYTYEHRIAAAVGTVVAPYMGYTLRLIATTPDGGVGLVMKKGKKQVIFWVDRDAEGNGPGWISVDTETKVG